MKLIALIGVAAMISLAGCANQPGIRFMHSQAQSVSWSGDVDDSATVYIQGGRTWVDNVTDKPVQNATAVFHGPMPAGPVTVQLEQLAGRGQVAVIQQPTQTDNYTAAVRILDPEPGPDHYSFVLTW